MSLTVFVGATSRSETTLYGDRGISVLDFDEATLTATPRHVETGIDNPSYVAVDGERGLLYAVSEVPEWLECTVSAFRIDTGSGKLTYINKQPTRGRTSCHVALLPEGRLGVANYSFGNGGPDEAVSFYPRLADGGIGAPDAGGPHSGPTGPNADRQEKSHAHCVLPTPDGKAVLVADLGLDSVFGYSADAEGRQLFRLAIPAGHGPRHLVAHPDGRFVYLLNELHPVISILSWDGAELRHVADVETLDRDWSRDDAAGAAIRLSPDGRHLYASTRGSNCISVFAVGEAGRTLSLKQIVSSGGEGPRDFCLTPSGRHLFAANLLSDVIVVLSRDAETGLLSDSGARLDVAAPQCVTAVDFGRS